MFPTNTGKVFIETREKDTVIIEFAISHSKATTYDYISEVILNYGDYHIVITYSDKYKILSLIVNDEEISVINEGVGAVEYPIGNEIFDIPLDEEGYLKDWPIGFFEPMRIEQLLYYIDESCVEALSSGDREAAELQSVKMEV